MKDKEEKKSFMTIIHDVDDLPRAWGVAPTEEESKEVAEKHWQLRIAERTAANNLDRSEERGKTTTQELTGNELSQGVLNTWLDSQRAHCVWSIACSDLKKSPITKLPVMLQSIACYRIGPGVCLVLRYTKGWCLVLRYTKGWDIFTPPQTNDIDRTFRDTIARLGIDAREQGHYVGAVWEREERTMRVTSVEQQTETWLEMDDGGSWTLEELESSGWGPKMED